MLDLQFWSDREKNIRDEFQKQSEKKYPKEVVDEGGNGRITANNPLSFYITDVADDEDPDDRIDYFCHAEKPFA